MHELEFWLLLTLLGGLIFGIWGIIWVRTGVDRNRVWWGARVFVGSLLFLGASALVAALHRAETLVPLGLTAGFLLVGMLWEGTPPLGSPIGNPLPEEV